MKTSTTYIHLNTRSIIFGAIILAVPIALAPTTAVADAKPSAVVELGKTLLTPLASRAGWGTAVEQRGGGDFVDLRGAVSPFPEARRVAYIAYYGAPKLHVFCDIVYGRCYSRLGYVLRIHSPLGAYTFGGLGGSLVPASTQRPL